LTFTVLVLSLCFPTIANPRSFAPATLPSAEPLAQIQAILINDAPADAPTIEQIQITRVGGATEPGRVGMPLFANDEVKTGSRVKASLVYEKADTEYNVQVQIHENSRARIESLWAYVGRFLVSGWGSFDTKTQEVRLGKRATEFYVDVAEDGSVDLKVLRGEVEVEKVAGEQPPGELLLNHPHARPLVETLKVKALEAVQVKKGERPTAPRELEQDEVETVLAKTDNLMIASLATTTPLNVIPTSYKLTPEIGRDPVKIRLAAVDAFKTARRKATLEPTPDNIAFLGDAFKDLGAGKRAVKEYEEAAREKPELETSVKFLANQAEAYRLAGNFVKARDKSEAAVARSQKPGTSSLEKQLAYNARANSTYEAAVQFVAAGDWDNARVYFNRTKGLYESAKVEAPGENYVVIADRNLLNVTLAIDATAGSAPDLSKFMGTYRGFVTFPGANISGPATVVINGNRFSLIHCEERLTAGIVLRERTADDLLVDLILDTSMPIKKLLLKVQLLDDKRLVLTNADTERNRFSFSTSNRQTPLTCGHPRPRKTLTAGRP
jgi:tetratricopeptide (TPR) repeat protein